MNVSRPLGTAVAVGCALVLATGCTLFGAGPEPVCCAPPPEDTVDYGEGPYVREGLFGAHDFPARVAVRHVERWEDRSVLRFTMTPTGGTGESHIFQMYAFGRGLTGRDWAFDLIDPVNGAHYAPLLNADDATIGSPMPNAWVPGADYEIEVHFPPIPDGVERVSVHSASTAGEFTGIPVVDGGPPAEPPSDSADHADIEPGDTVRMELRDTGIAGDPQDRVNDLYTVTDRPDRTDSRGDDEAVVALRADVLFDLDEAELTGAARATLNEVAEETRAQADPSRPPISIVGHTDGQGGDAYNQDLSERRAASVRAFLAEELGADYEYETEGRGATEPLVEEGGEDIEEDRAANRRVEISYRLLPEEEREPAGPESSEGTDATVSAAPADGAAPPAPFRPDDGAVVATGSTEFLSDSAGYDLDVYPMYRDGAYLVGVFELVHDGDDGSVPPVVSPLAAPEHPGGDFTRLSVSVPGDEENLRGVRVGAARAAEDGGAPFVALRESDPFPAGGESRRLFVYFPAPAEEVTEVDLDAGPFGEFSGVPVG
ncbi:OmpA family protein [Nocardiopsis sp. FIRDI 009]|uniref:OmpA family protein n=1 Tax=Nocardiopsis sp. FIRDI 009 TaxID=714197 RepID=UPI000E23B206|nr:OmpA family protein [Nocardiopsis sp. FIRDI 009]